MQDEEKSHKIKIAGSCNKQEHGMWGKGNLFCTRLKGILGWKWIKKLLGARQLGWSWTASLSSS